MNPQINTQIPCLGREQAKACYKIQIIFLPNQIPNFLINNYLSLVLLLVSLGLMLGLWFQKTAPKEFTPSPEANFISLGKYAFYTQQGVLKNQSETIELSEKETQLLQLLTNQINQTLTREQLTKELWENQGVFVGGRTLDVFISKLRKKLQADKSLKISNIHGKGYKLEVNDENINKQK
jgi:DNA-binding response OmpR family regulator